MSAEDIYGVWRQALVDTNSYPVGSLLTWENLPQNEKDAWGAVAEAANRPTAE